MSLKYQNHKKRKILWLFLIFCVIFIGNLGINLSGSNYLQSDNSNSEENDLAPEIKEGLDTAAQTYSGIGKALNTTEFGSGTFQNYNLNLTNNDNTSILVPDKWVANEISGNIFNIRDYDAYFLNDTFDSGYDSNHWTTDTDIPSLVSFGWYDAPSGPDDSIYMRFDGDGSPVANKYANWNYSRLISREQIPFETWQIDFKYRMVYDDSTWRIGTGGAGHSLFVNLNGGSQEFGLPKLETLVNNTWYSESISFQPEIYSFELPGTISLIFQRSIGNTVINPTGYLELLYDNITLTLSTIPKPSQINLTMIDVTHDDIVLISDGLNYGQGTLNFQNTWKGDVGGKSHRFSFSHNSSGNVIISSELDTQASSSKKTKTQLGLEGCEYLVQNSSEVEWTTYFTVTQPSAYSSEYYFNVTKPLNWVITQIIDPYLNNKIDDVIDSGYGNTTFKIPNNIITNGLWKFVAKSPNYVNEVNLFKKNNQEWMKNSTFYPLEKLKINGTASTVLISNPELTNACLTIFYPNGTIFHQENAFVSIGGTFEFSEITLGQKNATIGTYSACIKWSESVANMTQVGFYQLNFMVFHHTSLTPVKDYFEQTAGEPLLIKVQFMDEDLTTSIDYAEIKYISSFGSSGNMAYIGSGIYSSEIDTNGLSTGDYYFSINASKQYYENQTTTNLIHLKLTAQPLKLVFPSRLLNGTGNSYLIGKVDLEGELSGAPVPGANISTDWIQTFSYFDHGNGTYTLNFSTYGLPLEGVIEAYEIEIFANKTNFESVSDYVTLLVRPVATLANANQTSIIGFINENFEVKVNYTETNGELISGAGCTVSWPSNYDINPVSDGFIIKYYTINLEIDVYNSLIRFSKPGYEDALVSITAVINEQKASILVEVNGEEVLPNDVTEIHFKEEVNITARIFADREEIFLTGGNLMILSDHYHNDFIEYSLTYYSLVFTINGENFSSGLNTIYLRFEKENYTTITVSFQFFVRAQDVILEVKVDGNNFQENNLIERSYNNFVSLSCRAFADIEEVYLTEATVKLIIDTFEIDLSEYPNYWYNKTFRLSTDIFSLGLNYVYIKFELANYTTTTFSFQIQVRQIEIDVKTIGFIESLNLYTGDRVSIEINLTEDGTNNPIENATIYSYWEYGDYYFSELGEGLYKLEFDSSPNMVGNRQFNLVITSGEIIYKPTQFSFYISISERQLPNYLMNIIIISLIAIAGVLGILSLRSYVILPRKRKKALAIVEKTQPYKDTRNVEAIICSSKSSGLSLYSKTFSIIDDDYITGFSGFIQAITILEKQYTKKGAKKGDIKSTLGESEADALEIKELDFNFFNALICDYKNLRMIFVLRELSSERLRSKIEALTLELYSQCEETITQFKGNLNGINQKVERITYKYIPLYYKENFELNKSTHYNSVKLSGELSKLEIRFLNVLEAQSKFKPQFLLENMLLMVEDVSEDKKIIALETLIKQGLIKPAKKVL